MSTTQNQPCTFSRWKTPDTQATISRQCFLHVRGFDDGERIFTIEYGDDNLVSGTTIIDTAGPEHKLPVTWSPGQNNSDSIKRQPEILVPASGSLVLSGAHLLSGA
jgi:hypothetical protein